MACAARTFPSSSKKAGLPQRRPRRRAARMPSRVRSELIRDSISATAATNVKQAFPAAVDVSMPSCSERSSTPRVRNSSASFSRCMTVRPSRSSRQHTSVSPARNASSALSSSGRSAVPRALSM